MLEEIDSTRGLVGKYVDTYAFVDGRFEVRSKGRSLPYKIFDMDQRVTHAAVTGNKRLSAVLEHMKEMQDAAPPKPKVGTNSEKMGYKPNGKVDLRCQRQRGNEMKHVKLRVVSDDGVEATISTDCSQGGVEDYYSVVSVEGFMKDKKVYGIDSMQSFVLGLKLIEDLTADKRIGDDEEAAITPGTSWRIEVIED